MLGIESRREYMEEADDFGCGVYKDSAFCTVDFETLERLPNSD